MEYSLAIIKGVCAAVGGCVAYWLGGLDKLLMTLVAVIVLDYITGMLAAWHIKALSSRVGFLGISRKVMLLVVVALAYLVEDLTNGAFPLREITIMFFVVNESLSILENAAKLGLPLPAKLTEVLIQLGGKESKEED